MKTLLIILSLTLSGLTLTAQNKTQGEVKKEKTATSVCKGKTKAGTPCQHRTKDKSGYCYQHLSQSKTTNK